MMGVSQVENLILRRLSHFETSGLGTDLAYSEKRAKTTFPNDYRDLALTR